MMEETQDPCWSCNLSKPAALVQSVCNCAVVQLLGVPVSFEHADLWLSLLDVHVQHQKNAKPFHRRTNKEENANHKLAEQVYCMHIKINLLNQFVMKSPLQTPTTVFHGLIPASHVKEICFQHCMEHMFQDFELQTNVSQ